MSYKEFLKPDWRKIVIFIVLFFLSNAIPYIPIKDCSLEFGGCDWELCQPSLFYCKHTEAAQYYLGIENPWIQMILILFFMFVFPYLLSCLIIWVYDKLKKKS
ncbi:MAG: hypothetical protein AUJ24_00695 [Parcubacteria group bacterium CG1_02_36_42]|nr:MAG: hypothetical protein AUJ24_00695 [Parcubacteria group bacterium CG1_02_36_42]